MNQIETILNSPCGALNRHLETKPEKKKIIKARNDCPEVQWIHWQLKYWCLEKGIEYQKEHKFSKKRKFRFDFAIKDYHIGIEYQGLMSNKSGHTTLLGYTGDTEKNNLALSEGWRVLTFTVINYQTVIQKIESLIKT